MLSAANASAIASRTKPSVATSIVDSLVRQAYLSEISSIATDLLKGLDGFGGALFPLNHPLRLALKEIQNRARGEAGKDAHLSAIRKSLSYINLFLIQSSKFDSLLERNLVDIYLKWIFLANNNLVCSQVAASSHMRESLARSFENPLICWKLWIARENLDSPSLDWAGASLAASAVKAISSKTNNKVINLNDYMSKKFASAENLSFLEDMKIHEVDAGHSSRFLIAEMKQNKTLSSGLIGKGECIVVGAPSGAHVSKTSGKFSTTYADIVAKELVRRCK